MVYTLGESLMDIIFKDGRPVASRAGGSVLNSAVSLGRCQVPVSLVSELGADRPGDMILDFLHKNRVKTDFVYRYREGKTPVALAFLNRHNDASYSLYKPYPEKRLQIPLPEFNPGDMLLFGSFYSLTSEVRDKILGMVRQARKNGAYVIYDPNIRSPHRNQMETWENRVKTNVSMAHLVRASDEDFMTIYGDPDPENAWRICRDAGAEALIFTQNKNGVHLFEKGSARYFEVPLITPVSTIGAGDSFNAGVVFSLIHQRGEKNLEKAVRSGISFSSNVCMRYDNYISPEFAKSVLSTL